MSGPMQLIQINPPGRSCDWTGMAAFGVAETGADPARRSARATTDT